MAGNVWREFVQMSKVQIGFLDVFVKCLSASDTIIGLNLV